MKTYKRELAVALFIPLFFAVYYRDAELAQVLVWPTFTFAALAFGLDWHGKQLQQPPSWTSRGRDKRSREHSAGEDNQPELRDYSDYRTDDNKTESKDH